MPIYEYQCPQCAAVFEEWVSVQNASETVPCPHCSSAAKHIISNTSFVLKGGGWYVTDYGNRKADASAQASSPTTSPATPSAPETTKKAEVPAATTSPTTPAPSTAS